MSIKSFFNKNADKTKRFFNKAGSNINRAFSKGGAAEQLVNKVGQGIDTGLKVASNVAGKAGRVAASLAPALTLVNPELGLLAGAIGAGSQQVRDVTKQIKAAKKDAIGAYNNNSIMAPKPQENEPNINFA
jgi:hypothetical protein